MDMFTYAYQNSKNEVMLKKVLVLYAKKQTKQMNVKLSGKQENTQQAKTEKSCFCPCMQTYP